MNALIAINKACVVLASQHPERLAEFYSLAMGADIHSGVSKEHFFVIKPGELTIQIYRPSTKNDFYLPSRQMAICLRGEPSLHPLKVLEKWLVELASIGANASEKIRMQPFGAEVWVVDPDENFVLVLVPRLGSGL